MGLAAAVVGAAVVGAGASIAAGSMQSNAIKKGTDAQTKSNDAALALQKQQYDQQRADYAPWREVGQGALQQLAQIHGITVPNGVYTPGVNGTSGTGTGSGASGKYGGFFASPDYQFRVDEGSRAITGNAAAKGLLDSGDLGKGLINYGQAAGSQEFGNWYNRIAALAGVGQTATDGTTAAGQAAANNQSTILQNQGQNLASSYAAQGRNTAGMITGIGGMATGLINNIGTNSYGGTAGLGTSAGFGSQTGNVDSFLNWANAQ